MADREAEVIVQVINQQLKDLYSVDIVTGLPIFRVVWSEDQFEKRYGTFTDYVPGTNIFLREVTEVREVPKYRQWIHGKHILERLVLVPPQNMVELVEAQISYEPLWTFEDRNKNYLPPRLDACKFIIDAVLAAQAVNKMMIDGSEQKDNQGGLARYVDPASGKSTEELVAHKNAKIDGLVNELFGDASGLLGDTLDASGSSIIMPQNFVRSK